MAKRIKRESSEGKKMKKLWMILLISALMALSAFAVENTVYVTDGGTGDGTTAASPLGSLSAAYTALGDDGGRIVITDTVTLTKKFTEPAHSGKVTLTGGTLTVPSIRFVLNGATTFENMTIHGSGKYLTLVAQFHPVVFGEGLIVTGFGDFSGIDKGLTIVGGVLSGEGRYADDSLVSADTSITVKSGKAIIIGFCSKMDKAFTGTSDITIDGGTLYNIYYGSYNVGSGGNSNLTVSGGTFIYNVYSNAKIGKLSGNINVKITGGDFSAATLTCFDGSVTGEGATSRADVRGLANYSTLVEKMDGFTTIITDEGELHPQEKSPIQDAFLYGSFTASDGTVLPYRYYLPAGYATSGKDYPVLLYMHGNGSRGTNNTSQLNTYCVNNAVYESDYECIMIAPQCPSSPYEWTLYSTVGKVNYYPGSEKYAEFLESGQPYGSKYFCAAAELLDTFLTDYRADTSRVYLCGSSNGTGAVWNFLSLYPEVFAAAIPVAGCRAEPDFVHSVAHRMKNIPIWAFHGDLDNESGSPVEGTRTMAAAIEEVGGNITYTEVVGGNHSNIWRIAAETPGLIDWLFAQENDSFENTLSGAKGPALPAPANPRWYLQSAAWDAVDGAGAYKVTFYVDGVAAKTVFTPNLFYTPDLSALGGGECTFTVRAYPQSNAGSIGADSTASAVYTADLSSIADYDGDGTVNLADALTLLRTVLNQQTLADGDLNDDGKTTLADVLRLLKFIAKQE